jgi:hypothetical protein
LQPERCEQQALNAGKSDPEITPRRKGAKRYRVIQ